MKRLIDAERLKSGIFNACIDEHFKPTKLLNWDNITDIINNAPTVNDERIGRVLETIQTVIDNTNGNTDNVSKAMRNTAKFIRNAIDGEMPDYENVEGEDCDERPHGERRCYTCKYRACDITEMPCKECYRAYVDCYEETDNE